MRKITEQAVNFFLHNTSWNSGNTDVIHEGENITTLRLHKNPIAQFIMHDPLDTSKDEIRITTAGWNTNTTKERLRGIPGVRLETKKGQLYLNGKAWDGSWTTI